MAFRAHGIDDLYNRVTRNTINLPEPLVQRIKEANQHMGQCDNLDDCGFCTNDLQDLLWEVFSEVTELLS